MSDVGLSYDELQRRDPYGPEARQRVEEQNRRWHLARIERLAGELRELERELPAAIRAYCDQYGHGAQSEAARAAGVSRQAVSNMLRRRRLTA